MPTAASAGLVLTWPIAATGASTALAGLLLPLRQLGALLLQVAIAGWIPSLERMCPTAGKVPTANS